VVRRQKKGNESQQKRKRGVEPDPYQQTYHQSQLVDEQQGADENGPYPCPQCQRVFDNRLSLTRHMGHHTREQNRTNGVPSKLQSRSQQPSNGHTWTHNVAPTKPAGYAPPCTLGFGPPVRASPPSWVDGPSVQPGVAILGYGAPRCMR
jgi:hypothetical protein